MGALVRARLEQVGGFELLGTYDASNAAELDGTAPAADLAIDFSNKAALPHVLAYVRRTGAALLSGTTGFSDAELDELRALGEATRVVHSANYSLGVAVLRRMCAEAARALGDWDAEIVETHHNQKADAPSGTAKLLLEASDPAGGAPVPTVARAWWARGRRARSACTPCAAAPSPAPMRCTSLALTRRSASRTEPRAARSSSTAPWPAPSA